MISQMFVTKSHYRNSLGPSSKKMKMCFLPVFLYSRILLLFLLSYPLVVTVHCLHLSSLKLSTIKKYFEDTFVVAWANNSILSNKIVSFSYDLVVVVSIICSQLLMTIFCVNFHVNFLWLRF